MPAIAGDPNEPDAWLEWLMPDEDGLDLSNAVVHELLGMALVHCARLDAFLTAIDPMSQFIYAIFSVTGFGVLAAIGAAWLVRRPASAAARRFIVGVVATYVVLSIFAVPYTVGRLLVLGYHPFTAADVPRGRTAIVLLGAGGTTTVDWTGEHYSLLERVGAARVLEAVRVFKWSPTPVIVSSGGVGDYDQDVEAVMQRAALLHLGVPAASIVLEDQVAEHARRGR